MPQTKNNNAFKALIRQSGQSAAFTEPGQGSREKQAGRRNHPDYTQVAAYIPQALYKQVKMKLLQEHTKRNFSELMEALLADYVFK